MFTFTYHVTSYINGSYAFLPIKYITVVDYALAYINDEIYSFESNIVKLNYMAAIIYI